MTVRDLIYTLAQKDGMSLNEMSAKIGQSRNAVYKGIYYNEGQKMRIDTFLNWMTALGYEVIVQDPFGGEQDEWVLDGESEGVEHDNERLNHRRTKSWT